MINEWLKKYSELKDQEKQLKAQMTETANNLKTYLQDNSIEEYVNDGIKISYKPTEKSSVNEERLIAKIKKLARSEKDLEKRKLLKSSIKKVEAIDENVLEELIYTNVINSQELEECYESKVTYTLRLAQPKNKK